MADDTITRAPSDQKFDQAINAIMDILYEFDGEKVAEMLAMLAGAHLGLCSSKRVRLMNRIAFLAIMDSQVRMTVDAIQAKLREGAIIRDAAGDLVPNTSVSTTLH